MSKDKIPNIRLNVAKTIGTIRSRFQAPGQNIGPIENGIESEMLAILNDLKSDVDDDVKYYTKKAISKRLWRQIICLWFNQKLLFNTYT